MRRDWLLRDCKTGEVLTRASRRLLKIPDEVRAEIEHRFLDAPPVVDNDGRKLPKLDEAAADYVGNGLTPRLSDLDFNQHVNNVKYIGWILESAPQEVVEKYKLASLTLEYRLECRKDSVVNSLTCILDNSGSCGGGIADSSHVDCQHVLQFEDDGSGGAARRDCEGKDPLAAKAMRIRSGILITYLLEMPDSIFDEESSNLDNLVMIN